MRGLFRARWSERILDEVVNSVRERRPELTADQLKWRIGQMNEAMPDALVKDFQRLEDSLASLGTDAHVIAAAVIGGVDVIVTANVRDFTDPILEQACIEVRSPDDFLVDQFWLDPDSVIDVLRTQAASTRRPPLTINDVLAGLSETSPQFVALVRERLNSHKDL